ncbi:MAG: tetratricopeptide repeat protein, partial [Parachlamydiaceae bacterium]
MRAKGDKETAIRMLETFKAKGKPEVLRLMRLSFLNEKQDPKKAWDYLIEASKEDPINPDLRSLRGALLEKVGKLSLAQKEYQDALTLNPESSELWDQLAQFYVRQGQWTRALITWQHALSLPNSESVWINLIFWSKIIRPLDFQMDLKSLEGSHLKHFITYLYELPKDKFWDSEKYRSLEKGAELLQTFQQTFWLRLLQALQDNNFKEAYDLIAFNPFRNKSYRIDLEAATLIALNFKLNNTLELPDALRNDLSINVDPSIFTRKESHQLLRLLSIDKRDLL